MARVKKNGGMSLHLQLLKMWLCILKILVSNIWTLHICIHRSVYIQVLTIHDIQYPRKDEQLHGIKKTLPDHRYVWEHKVNPWARQVWTVWSTYTQIFFSINIVGPSYPHFASQIQPTIDQNQYFHIPIRGVPTSDPQLLIANTVFHLWLVETGAVKGQL